MDQMTVAEASAYARANGMSLEELVATFVGALAE